MAPFEDDAESDDDSDDRDLPQSSDIDPHDDDASVDTVPCPGCGRPVYEHADLCPHCGQFILSDRKSRRPLWILVGTGACIILILLYLLG